MKAHIFLITIPKFQLQIHYTLEIVTENVSISIIPNFFLCIFTKASLSPVPHSYFWLRRENKKKTWAKIAQNVSYGSRSISWEQKKKKLINKKKYMSKLAHPTLTTEKLFSWVCSFWQRKQCHSVHCSYSLKKYSLALYCFFLLYAEIPQFSGNHLISGNLARNFFISRNFTQHRGIGTYTFPGYFWAFQEILTIMTLMSVYKHIHLWIQVDPRSKSQSLEILTKKAYLQ